MNVRCLPRKLAERMQALHHAGALRPAAAAAGRQRDHGQLAVLQGVEPTLPKAVRQRVRGMHHVVGPHILDVGVHGQAVLRQADPAIPDVVADLLVLHCVEATLLEQFAEAMLWPGAALESRQQVIEQPLHDAGQFRISLIFV